MDIKTFNVIRVNQMAVCGNLMQAKQSEYAAVDDVLSAFRIAGNVQGIPMRAALAGMMIKHTISIYDMCNTDTIFALEQWEEKITDHINYLMLLKAVIVEEREETMAEDRTETF